MSVGKSSISRISAGTSPKKKAPVKKSPEVAPTEEVKAQVATPAKKPAAKKTAPKKVQSNGFKIYQVSDELPYYLL